MLLFGEQVSWRLLTAIFLLVAALIILLIQLSNLLPQFLHHPLNDYDAYIIWGKNAEAGVYSYMHPLPALIWIFVPLSHLPRWFVLVWTLISLISVLYFFGKKGIPLWLFYPLLTQLALGELDGLLLLPLYWLINNHSALEAFQQRYLHSSLK